MKNGKMNVVVRGLYPAGSLGRGAKLSPYYFVDDQYDPLTGRPKNIHRLAGAFMPIQRTGPSVRDHPRCS